MLFRLIPREIPRTKVDWIQRPQPKMSIWKSCLFIYMLENVLEKITRVSITWLKKTFEQQNLFVCQRSCCLIFSYYKNLSNFYRLIYYLCVSVCDVRVYFLRSHIYRSMDQIESEEKTQYNKKEDNEDNKANLPKTNDSSLPKKR